MYRVLNQFNFFSMKFYSFFSLGTLPRPSSLGTCVALIYVYNAQPSAKPSGLFKPPTAKRKHESFPLAPFSMALMDSSTEEVERPKKG